MNKYILSGMCAVTCLISFAGCSKSEKSAAQVMNCVSEGAGIVGGDKVSSNDRLAKKVVLLLTRVDGGLKICTGTPIAKDVILTAAHCVKGDDKNNMNVVFRTSATCSSGFNLSNEGVKVQDFITHAGYQDTDKAVDDVALVKLQSPIPADYEVSEFYDGKSKLSNNNVILAGYGITDELQDNSSAVLRTTTKDYKDKEELEIEDNHVFFRQSFGGICMGDSGGPVFFEVDGKLKIAGVNSIVAGKTKSTVCHGIGVAMYVPYYSDWIQTQSANLK